MIYWEHREGFLRFFIIEGEEFVGHSAAKWPPDGKVFSHCLNLQAMYSAQLLPCLWPSIVAAHDETLTFDGGRVCETASCLWPSDA